jgi:hypothetical protein
MNLTAQRRASALSSAPMKRPSKEQPWSIYLLRRRLTLVGFVHAKDATSQSRSPEKMHRQQGSRCSRWRNSSAWLQESARNLGATKPRRGLPRNGRPLHGPVIVRARDVTCWLPCAGRSGRPRGPMAASEPLCGFGGQRSRHGWS